MNSIFLMMALIGAALCEVVVREPCPDVQPVQNFNLTAFLGTWFKFSTYEDIYQDGTRCNCASYFLNKNGSIGILDQALLNDTEIGIERQGVVNVVGDNAEGRLNFWYEPGQGNVGEFIIVGTNYTTWASMWSCTDFDGFSVRFATIWSRLRYPYQEIQDTALSSFQTQGIPTDILDPINNENCPYI